MLLNRVELLYFSFLILMQVKANDQNLGVNCIFKEFCSPCTGLFSVRPTVGEVRVCVSKF